ncbi:hypothetical protein ACNKHW_24130 [Shigella flexneri]
MQGRAEHHKYHMEYVHRAGGVIGILGELDCAGYCTVRSVTCWNDPAGIAGAIRRYADTRGCGKTDVPRGPAGIRTTKAFSQDCRWGP